MTKYLLFFIVFLSYKVDAQVINDDCANAIDYGVLDYRMSNNGPDGALYDTCFEVSNIGSIPNFPFYYNNDFCGQQIRDSVNGAFNDVWYKVRASGFLQISLFLNSSASNTDTARITFWGGNSNPCGNFFGGRTHIIPLDNGYFWDYLWISGGPELLIQVSANVPTDTIVATMCLVGVQAWSGVYCSITSSTYDSLCFLTNIQKNNPSTATSSDGTIVINVESGRAPFHYNWNSGDTTSSLNNLGVGNYSLTITDSANCAETFDFTLSAPTSLEDFREPKNMVYPNPTKDFIIMHLDGMKEIYIYNNQGRLYKQVRTEDSKIHTAELPNGLYFLKINLENGNKLETEKIIIKRN